MNIKLFCQEKIFIMDLKEKNNVRKLGIINPSFVIKRIKYESIQRNNKYI